MIEIETKHTHPFLAMKLINDLQIALYPVGWGIHFYSLLLHAINTSLPCISTEFVLWVMIFHHPHFDFLMEILAAPAPHPPQQNMNEGVNSVI